MDLTGPRVQHAPSFASGTSGLLRMPMLDSHQHSRQHWSPCSSSMSQCEEDAKNALEETYEETSNFIVRSRRSVLLNDVVCSNLRRLYNPSINHPTSTNDSHSGWKERNRRHVGDAMERSGLMWSQKPSFLFWTNWISKIAISLNLASAFHSAARCCGQCTQPCDAATCAHDI